MRSLIKGLLISMKKERGATAIEYALMVALISVAIILTVTALGGQINTVYNNIITTLGG